MRRVQAAPLAGLACVAVLLGVLAATAGLTPVGVVAGAVSGIALNAALALGLSRREVPRLGPADRVTLLRAVLGCGVAALVADSFTRPAPVGLIVGLSAAALVLDLVDGRVARLTGTVSALGARFDLEADAFLILVLSGYVARTTGWWVLLIGLARYLFVAAGQVLPWLRGSAPPRYWCKVVAALQGVVLTLVAADVVPPPLEAALLAVCLGLLAESFGREAVELRRVALVARGGPADRRLVGVVGDA